MNGSEGRQTVPLGRRLMARLVDDMVTLLLMGVTVGMAAGPIVLLAVLGLGDDFLTSQQSSTDWIWVVLLGGMTLATPLCLLAMYFYYQVLAARRSGQTLAKRHLGMCIVLAGSDKRTPVGVGRLLSRCAILHVPAVALAGSGLLRWPTGDRWLALGGLGWLLAASAPAVLSRSDRGVHDWVAGTAVVAVPVPRRGSLALTTDASDRSASVVKPIGRSAET